MSGIYLPSDSVAAPSGPLAVVWSNLTGITDASGTLSKSAANGSFTNAVGYAVIQVPAGDFTFTWSTPSGSFDGGVVGLKLVTDGVPTTAGGLGQYAYAINFNDSDLFGASSQVYEAGGAQGSVFATPGNDSMTIRRVGTTITYLQGVTTRYTNASASAAALYIGCNPYANTGAAFLTGAIIA